MTYKQQKFLTVLKAGKSKIEALADSVFAEGLGHRELSCCCVCPWWKGQGSSLVSFIRELIPSMRACPPKEPTSKYQHYEFWGDTNIQSISMTIEFIPIFLWESPSLPWYQCLVMNQCVFWVTGLKC